MWIYWTPSVFRHRGKSLALLKPFQTFVAFHGSTEIPSRVETRPRDEQSTRRRREIQPRRRRVHGGLVRCRFTDDGPKVKVHSQWKCTTTGTGRSILELCRNKNQKSLKDILESSVDASKLQTMPEIHLGKSILLTIGVLGFFTQYSRTVVLHSIRNITITLK